MSKFLCITVAFALFGAAACGGGSTGGDPADFVTVQGKLETRDGTADALDGVLVTCVETGATDMTDGVGAFQMHVPRGQAFHLDFDDPRWQGSGPHHDGAGEHHDPYRDGAEIDGGGVTLRPDGPQDWCDVEVHLESGEIVECHVRWGDGQNETRDGERPLDRDPLCDEVGAFGEIEISVTDGCLAIEVEVDGFSGAASLDVYLVDMAGEEAFLGALEVDSDGVGHMELSWCEGDALPFDAASPEDLAGAAVVVYDEVGEIVFRGHLPHQHEDAEGHHHHGWEDEDAGHEHGGPGDMGGPGGGPHRGR